MLRIKSFPRIHITLIGMNHDGYRRNGGIGFSIASPSLELSFVPASFISIVDKRRFGFLPREICRLQNHLYNVFKKERLKIGMSCVIHESLVESHVGFGSNTMIYFSCVEALLILNQRAYTENDVISLSGRGGTSGIGINTYFYGGFVFDTGIANRGNASFAPSSAFVESSIRPPLFVKGLSLPTWELGVCIPDIEHKTEEEEQSFFNENCPIEKEAVEEILYESVYGITSSLMENDVEVFCKSINAIQKTKWKRLERQLYGNDLIQVEGIIKNAGAKCVGMSSLGPLLFFMGDHVDTIIDELKTELPQCRCFKTSTNNSGRLLQYD